MILNDMIVVKVKVINPPVDWEWQPSASPLRCQSSLKTAEVRLEIHERKWRVLMGKHVEKRGKTMGNMRENMGIHHR